MAKDLQISPSYLCKIEKGLQEPSKKLMCSCAEYLSIPENELFPERTPKSKIENINSTFQNMLWSTRNARGIKQKDLARSLGCSPSYLSKVEKGFYDPNLKFKNKCAKILKIKVVELFPKEVN